MATLRVAVLGAGNLGTTLGMVLCGGLPGIRAGRTREVVLWTIEEDVAREIRGARLNTRYLPGATLPRALGVTTDLAEAVGAASILVVALPSSVVRPVARQLGEALRPAPTASDPPAVVSASKGLEAVTHLRMSQVLAAELPSPANGRILALSGPSIAHELSRGVPTGVALACDDLTLARAVRRELQTPVLRLSLSRDVAGVELGGVLKNAYALLFGLCDGLGLGLNSKAAILTRAVPEMARLGVALGGRRATFFGLPGLGDLVGTGLSDYSRNRKMGEALARRHDPGEPLPTLPGVVEGLGSLRVALELGARHKVRLPILQSIAAVIDNGADPLKTIVRLVG
ncbi:MAG: NAD(P)H-dependent glycerol-3-phosphate dehydrogenase [Candidatus Polarisedimenticolia bacterium]